MTSMLASARFFDAHLFTDINQVLPELNERIRWCFAVGKATFLTRELNRGVDSAVLAAFIEHEFSVCHGPYP